MRVIEFVLDHKLATVMVLAMVFSTDIAEFIFNAFIAQ